MLEKCHHFTLTDSFVIVQKVLVPASEFKKKRWMEEADTLNIKFGFSLLIKFSPLYFQKTYHLLNLRGILQQKPMKIMTSLLWYILWSFYASLNIYVTHRGQLKCLVMFSIWWNVTSNWAQMLIIVILLVMSAASKLVGNASKLDWYSEAKTEA